MFKMQTDKFEDIPMKTKGVEALEVKKNHYFRKSRWKSIIVVLNYIYMTLNWCNSGTIWSILIKLL